MAIVPWPQAAMVWLRCNAYFRAMEGALRSPREKRGTIAAYVAIVSWPQAAMVRLRRDAYFRAMEGALRSPREKRGTIATYVAIVPCFSPI